MRLFRHFVDCMLLLGGARRPKKYSDTTMKTQQRFCTKMVNNVIKKKKKRFCGFLWQVCTLKIKILFIRSGSAIKRNYTRVNYTEKAIYDKEPEKRMRGWYCVPGIEKRTLF